MRGIVFGSPKKLPFKLGEVKPVANPRFFSITARGKSIAASRISAFHFGREMPPDTLAEFAKENPFGKIIERSASCLGINLQETLAEKPLIDLGCGRAALPIYILFAKSYGASSYVGVDIDILPETVDFIAKCSITSNIATLLCETDMATFLRAMPEGSQANFMLNTVIGHDCHRIQHKFTDFETEFAAELTRATASGCMAFGLSPMLLSSLSKTHWQLLGEEKGKIDFAIRN